MEPLSTFLSSLLGKVVAGSALAAASVAGMNAADVVELPLPDLSDKPAEVTTDDEAETPELPAGAESGQEAAEAKADNAADAEAKKEAAAEREAAGQESGQDDADTGESQGIGEAVSAAASEGEGPARDRVLPLTPANERAHDAGAPDTAGERQDGEVRQDDGAGQDDAAPRSAEVAEEHAPEDPGSQADGRRDGAAAEGARS